MSFKIENSLVKQSVNAVVHLLDAMDKVSMMGVTGPEGGQGEIGVSGDTGPRGRLGMTGVTGPRGEMGVTGPSGNSLPRPHVFGDYYVYNGTQIVVASSNVSLGRNAGQHDNGSGTIARSECAN